MLTVGYGEGHNAAARALAQSAVARGWLARIVDPCAESSPRIFKLTQKFYQLCVKRAPWLWGITYAQTENADWSTKANAPILRRVTTYIQHLLEEYNPDIVLCVYPLFGYMLDVLKHRGICNVPYGIVVTDALEISRPWMLTKADVTYLPDEYSLALVQERYALSDSKLSCLGFPVRREFDGKESISVPPTSRSCHITYGAYAPTRRCIDDVLAIKELIPGATITVIAGSRFRKLCFLRSRGVEVIEKSNDMASLLQSSHLYIGKAGAATVFEAYALNLPVIINYSLPGQEQGNRALLELDSAGCSVSSTGELIHVLSSLLDDDARLWRSMKSAMAEAHRKDGAERIIRDVEKRFLYE